MPIPKISSHKRSLSLPSTSHPLDASIEDHFGRVRASRAGPSSASICQNLCNMKDLYQKMDSVIHLPHNQQALSHKHHRKEVEGVLDGSLPLLDTSSSALDALSHMKESIIDLKSALRTGNYDEGIHVYFISRKKICKALSKCLADTKKAEKICTLTQTENVSFTVKMLKEAETISLSMLKSVFSYVMGKRETSSQTNSWSLVAKLVKSKHAASSDAEDSTEVVCIDQALNALSKNHSGAETKAVLRQLETLEKAITELEYGLESISRCFVKTRVSLLNVLNQ